MAGIEQLEIHSKSYIIRWVKVDEGHSISWSVQPHKKSINFGIVKHPGSGATNLSSYVADPTPSLDQDDGVNNSKSGRFGRKDNSTAQEQLASKGFIPVKWHGKCEADKVSIGTYDVPQGQGGMFGLVFDNTFSKQMSKTATFVLLTYPTGAPPHVAHHLPNLQAGPNATASKTSLGKHSPHLGPVISSDSTESLQSRPVGGKPASIAGRSDQGTTSSTYHTGTLYKRRRKKGQGHARRFFSLDYSSCTLSYYHSRNSSALRGATPLSLAAIAADERRREISIDSGAEVWHLRASNAKEFTEWARALEKASRIARGLEPPARPPSRMRLTVATPARNPPNTQQEEDREWRQVEALVSQIVGTRDALRRLVKDMAAQKQPMRPVSSSHLSPGTPSMPEDSDGYFTPPTQERLPFWKRKPSSSTLTPSALSPSISSALAFPTPSSATTVKAAGLGSSQRLKPAGPESGSTQEHCAALLKDLDHVVAEFTNVIANSKRRRIPAPRSSTSRRSVESSISADEFFDAEAGDMDVTPQVMMIDRQESEEDSHDHDSGVDDASIDDSSSVSSIDDDADFASRTGDSGLFPPKPKSLAPLPVDIAVDRRKTIPPATAAPPSLAAFVRKNVGKDLTTISMPVSSNEPTSMLQRVAEQLEYSTLLDEAAQQKTPRDRLLFVTAFAISSFSISRLKERANRKPFNPLLGETFELLRTESEVPGGFRLVAEKVTHRPVRLAIQADAASWSFTQSPAPAQKFWGKSAEITTEGRVRVALRLSDGADDLYSWNISPMYLRNMVMGEKYIEPVGTMMVSNDSTGAKANIEFKTKGMFGGRSEDVQVDLFGPDGSPTGAGLTGTWTNCLRTVESGKAGQEIWKVGELVANASTTYGMTTFAAGLNEITPIESGRLPPTDSRLRPDQRLAEEGRLDDAETWKNSLEEAQRARRRDMEERGEEHVPRWFVKVAGEAPDGEEVWKLKTGRDSYWEERARGEWKDVLGKIFEVP